MKVLDLSVNDIFLAMSDGERMHMANKLNKEGYQPIKLVKALEAAKESSGEAPADRLDSFSDDELALLWHGLNVPITDLRRIEASRRTDQPELTKSALDNSYSLWYEVNETCRQRGLRTDREQGLSL